MRRFFLFLILFYGLVFLFYIIVLIDFKPVTINISGYLSLEDNANLEGLKVEVSPFYPKPIFRKPVKHFFTDSTGFYKLEEVEAPLGPLGEIFILWLDGCKKKGSYLKLKMTKKGYLPTEVLILKFKPSIKVPLISLDKESGRKQLNEIISENEVKIIKNVTPYKFCPLHDYLWFYPTYYDLEIRIPTEDVKKEVAAKLRLIIKPLYTNFEEELDESTAKLRRLIRTLIPEISTEEIKLQGGENFANSLANPSLLDKINEILFNSKIKHIRLIDLELVKKGRVSVQPPTVSNQ